VERSGYRIRSCVAEQLRNHAARIEHPITFMRKIAEVAVLGLLAMLCASCSSSQPPASQTSQTPAPPTAPQVPDDIQTAGNSVLGTDAEVLAFGDLAKNGHTQALVVNRLKTTPQGTVPGTLVSRVSIIEKDDGKWKEIFRCDEHLKNTSGFLGGIPLAAVSSWRLQFEQHEDKGLVLYFTPLEKPAGGYVQTIGVRWNPQVKRYQSLDRQYDHFLTEVPALETPQSQVRM
jgi:hypothetical protein